MKILYTHARGAVASFVSHPLSEHAVAAYGHCLNTPERVNREHDGREFAEAIREVYDCSEGVNQLVVSHLSDA